MKVAVVGSRNINIDITPYIPVYCTAILSGGAKGVDSCAAKYAMENGLQLIEYLPNYRLYGKMAPLIRNDKIIKEADLVIALWDGRSKGTRYVINRCRQFGKKVKIIFLASS